MAGVRTPVQLTGQNLPTVVDFTLVPEHTVPFFFFFNHTATPEIYTLSLHDALPISAAGPRVHRRPARLSGRRTDVAAAHRRDRKSTRLNSSHLVISYAVFCLKK